MFILLILAIILSLYAQSNVTGTYNKYAKVQNRRGYTGAQVATMMMENTGVYDVTVERVAGNLTDHYDPRTKTLRLSQGVYDSTSVAALGIAAHETGHAIQHDVGYGPLALRSILVPVANLGSRMAMPLIFMGMLFSSSSGNFMIQLGIIFFAASVAFTLITLPVEFDASARAIDLLVDQSFLDESEIGGAKKVLKAAALTYVAAAIVAVVQLLRLIGIFGRRNN
ncbi:putative neutral zinc metallopeptidase [Anaerotignum neopropionicum]|uniref:Putative neutral zinc metallopeptidase n=1 Tax=Anaerotignum neopropionicum TaxID=36847 RepID=A0A136WB39_9FIRM|nr:zinc metallopeptidase [Anaerotignum neopropionicum]KXL51731.1 putative neutral zinc metallopeptidase [Anaerotignum neopropionicum]